MHEYLESGCGIDEAVVNPRDEENRVEAARLLFQRTLANWASDMLVLRSQACQGPRWPDLVDPDVLWTAA